MREESVNQKGDGRIGGLAVLEPTGLLPIATAGRTRAEAQLFSAGRKEGKTP